MTERYAVPVCVLTNKMKKDDSEGRAGLNFKDRMSASICECVSLTDSITKVSPVSTNYNERCPYHALNTANL